MNTLQRTTSTTRSTWTQDLVSSLIGLWIIVGITSDGYLGGLESFFTPWHGLLYSGLLAFVAWLTWLGLRGVRAGRTWRDALPAGYGASALGAVVFGAGGFADMIWHLIFGVEAGLDALLSPTHLILLTGGLLLLTTGLRATLLRHNGLPDSARDGIPAMLSLGATAAIAAFFLSYLSVFVTPGATTPLTTIPEGEPGHLEGELPAVLGLGSYLVTSLVLIVPALLASRYGRLPQGTVAVVVTVVALHGAALTGFRYLLPALGAIAGGILADLVLHSRATRDGDRARWVVGAGVPLLVWPLQLIGLAVAEGVRWPIELWSGVVIVTAMLGLALATLTKLPDTSPVTRQA